MIYTDMQRFGITKQFGKKQQSCMIYTSRFKIYYKDTSKALRYVKKSDVNVHLFYDPFYMNHLEKASL